MNRAAGGSVLIFVGVATLQVGLTDVHLRYVKPAMAPLLVVAGVLLLVAGAIAVLGKAPGHDHGAPRTSWLLVLPVLVLVVVTPQALGAYAAERAPASIAEPVGVPNALPPDRDGAADITVGSYGTRAVYAPETVEGRRVRMSGFVSYTEDGGWAVTRIRLSCCAADGRPQSVEVLGAPAPPRDTWVEVVASPAGLGQQVAVDDATVTVVPTPTNPYG